MATKKVKGNTMKTSLPFFAALAAATLFVPSPASAQEVATPLKGNVTITQRYYTEADVFANIETAAGATNPQGNTPAVTILNDPHNPAFNPLTGEWVEDGPVFAIEPQPQSLRDRVRGKMMN